MDREIVWLRKKIDNIDRQIMDLLKERFRVVKKLVGYKKSKRIAVEDKIREREIKERYVQQGFSKKFIDGFFGLMFNKVKK